MPIESFNFLVEDSTNCSVDAVFTPAFDLSCSLRLLMTELLRMLLVFLPLVRLGDWSIPTLGERLFAILFFVTSGMCNCPPLEPVSLLERLFVFRSLETVGD